MVISSPEMSVSFLEQLHETENADAWDRIVAVYTSLLRSWLRAAGLQNADCDDLTQRVLEVMVRQLPEFEHNGRPGAFRARLQGITVNLLREYWRQRPTPDSAPVLHGLVDPRRGLSQFWDLQHDRHMLQSRRKSVQPEFAKLAWTAFYRLALVGARRRFPTQHDRRRRSFRVS